MLEWWALVYKKAKKIHCHEWPQYPYCAEIRGRPLFRPAVIFQLQVSRSSTTTHLASIGQSLLKKNLGVWQQTSSAFFRNRYRITRPYQHEPPPPFRIRIETLKAVLALKLHIVPPSINLKYRKVMNRWNQARESRTNHGTSSPSLRLVWSELRTTLFLYAF